MSLSKKEQAELEAVNEKEYRRQNPRDEDVKEILISTYHMIEDMILGKKPKYRHIKGTEEDLKKPPSA